MNKSIAIKIIIISGILFPLLVPFSLVYFKKWSIDPSDVNSKKLGQVLNICMVFMMSEILFISFYLYQYGRNFIHVMGTFY